MVHVAAAHRDRWWFGVAWEGTDLVATATGANRDEAVRAVLRCIPGGVETEIVEPESTFFEATVMMLARLESGDESGKSFSLSRRISEPMRRILTVAAAIPIGYVTTYGRIAHAAESEARAVGRAMATNPLYPIVPCHRVVGADLALVGYGGKQDADALAAKLHRIATEMRGFDEEIEVPVPGGSLAVIPAERVVHAARDALGAERLQLPLF